MRKRNLKRLLVGSSLLAICVSTAPAFAQQATGPEASTEVVVVTGTRIAREGYVSSSPIATVGADELDKQVTVDVEQVLRDLPQFAPGNGGQVNNGSSGTSTLDLRGLTTPRTLPLVDGKRMVGFDPNGLFDVSAVPIALLKRVDVVTGGASAVYGSDAVAGVVNFILDDEFKGLQVDGNYSITDHGDGESSGVGITMGAGLDDGRGNVVLSVNYLNREAVYQTRGPGAATPGASSTTDPTAIDSATGARTQFRPDGTLATGVTGFDFNPYNLYQSPQTRWTGTALAKYDINDKVEAYARFIYNNSQSDTVIAPAGTFGFPFAIPVNNPFLTTQARNYLTANNPVGNCDNDYGIQNAAGAQCVQVGVRWRSVGVGPRITAYDYNTFQALGGLRGEFMGWNWDIAGAHGETSLQRTQKNDVSANKVQQAFFATSQTACFDAGGGCSPLNLFNPALGQSAAALNFIGLDLTVASLTQQDYITGSISGDIPFLQSPLAASPVAVSFGSEYRQEETDFRPDAAAQSGATAGFGQTLPIAGQYDVFELFTEGLIPIVSDKPFIEAINLELGYRTSNYSSSGVTESYKYGADYSPIPGLRFRAMFQRAVRAANISELYSPRLPGTGDLLTDPCANGTAAAPLTGALRALCIATGVPTSAIAGGTLAQPTSGQVNNFSGGKSTLTPEEADTVTFGAVWQPDFVPGLGMTIDYYDIEVNNAIALRPIFDVIDGCYSPTRNTAMSATAADCALIHRNTINGSMEGALRFGVDQLNDNIGQVHVEGIDYGIRYAFDIGSYGRIEASFDGTHVLDSSYVPVKGQETVSCEGSYGKQCGLPSTVSASTGGPTSEDRFSQRTTWTFGKFDVSYLWRYMSAVDVDPSQASTPAIESDHIDAYSYFDLSGSFKLNDMLKLRVAVQNVTDEEAPFVQTETGSTSFNSGNTYPSTYDSLGRIFSIGVTSKF